MNPDQLADEAARLAEHARALAAQAPFVSPVPIENVPHEGAPFIYLFAVFLMACFVGYYLCHWRQ